MVNFIVDKIIISDRINQTLKGEKENVNCCPKCGSHRVQEKKGGKMRCLDCGKKYYYCIREVWIEVKEE